MKIFSQLDALSLKKFIALNAVIFFLAPITLIVSPFWDKDYVKLPLVFPLSERRCVSSPNEIPGLKLCGTTKEKYGVIVGNTLINIIMYISAGGLMGILIFYLKGNRTLNIVIALLLIIAGTLTVGYFTTLKYRHISDCSNYFFRLKKGFNEAQCYINSSVRNYNPQLCDPILQEESRNLCYTRTAGNIKDHHLCTNITQEGDKNLCIRFVAMQKEDTSICQFINDDERKSECISTIEYFLNPSEEI